MLWILPEREVAERKGWKFQVQWIEDGNPCFIRCQTEQRADELAQRFRKQGLSPIIIDLIDALQLH